jgi:hypothetical protein
MKNAECGKNGSWMVKNLRGGSIFKQNFRNGRMGALADGRSVSEAVPHRIFHGFSSFGCARETLKLEEREGKDLASGICSVESRWLIF